MSTNKGKARKGARIDAAAERCGISSSYYEELQDTFKLFDTESTGALSTKKLRLAMRTLGFEATAKDIDEIVHTTSLLSVHQRRKHREQRKQRAKSQGTIPPEPTTSTTKAQPQRKSTRAAAIVAALEAQSKYVDSKDDDSEIDRSGDDSDAGDDYYKDEAKSSSASTDEDLYFTFDDFVLIMSPSEGQHASDEVSRVFSLFDTQGKGVIGLEDLRRVASELGMLMKDQELREMIEEASRDGHDGVTEQEFSKLMKKCGF